MALVDIPIYALYGNMGKVAYFHHSAEGINSAKFTRTLYPTYFKGKHLKTITFKSAHIGFVMKNPPIVYNKVYNLSEIYDIIWNFKKKKTAKKKSKPTYTDYNKTYESIVHGETLESEQVSNEAVPNPDDRPTTPIQGDYILLVAADGRHTEDFTFASKVIEVQGTEIYVIEDMYGKTMTVEALPERDNWPRKAWKQIPQAAASA
jgi:hypothetical protein